MNSDSLTVTKFDIETTGATREQSAAFHRAFGEYMEYRASAFASVKALCQDGDGFAMAHLFKGYLLLSMGAGEVVDAARDCHRRALACGELTRREQLHARALSAWADGDTESACNLWGDIMRIAPCDMLAIKLQHFALFWRGEFVRMRDELARVLPAWSDDAPGYYNLLGAYSFALQETAGAEQGDVKHVDVKQLAVRQTYARAEQLGRCACDNAPDDLWALHAVAHIFEMQGRLREGQQWLDRPLDFWDDRNPFRGHLWWHLALFAFDAGDYDRALDLYDSAVRPAPSTFYLDLQNTASLLARLEFAGVDVGARWQALLETVRERVGDVVLAFTEPHYAMVLARCNDVDALTQQCRAQYQLASKPNNATGALVDNLIAPLCAAIGAFHRGDASTARAMLAPLVDNCQPIGGSWAQRDVFALYLIESAIAEGDFVFAKQLLCTRVQRRPNSAPSWQKYLQVCERLGDERSMGCARRELERIASR